ncbi:hypothetical protein FHY12_000006 [Xanthomonas arboricola]|nr:hypothetical protein [Xanthomonas euroxanthea]
MQATHGCGRNCTPCSNRWPAWAQRNATEHCPPRDRDGRSGVVGSPASPALRDVRRSAGLRCRSRRPRAHGPGQRVHGPRALPGPIRAAAASRCQPYDAPQGAAGAPAKTH